MYSQTSSDPNKIKLLARLLKAEAITVEEYILLVTDTFEMSRPYNNPWTIPYYQGTTTTTGTLGLTTYAS